MGIQGWQDRPPGRLLISTVAGWIGQGQETVSVPPRGLQNAPGDGGVDPVHPGVLWTIRGILGGAVRYRSSSTGSASYVWRPWLEPLQVLQSSSSQTPTITFGTEVLFSVSLLWYHHQKPLRPRWFHIVSGDMRSWCLRSPGLTGQIQTQSKERDSLCTDLRRLVPGFSQGIPWFAMPPAASCPAPAPTTATAAVVPATASTATPAVVGLSWVQDGRKVSPDGGR